MPSKEAPKRAYETEPWFRDLILDYLSGAKRFFVLHGNIRDIILLKSTGDPTEYKEMWDARTYLVFKLMSDMKTPFDGVIFYSLTRGFYTLSSEPSKELFQEVTKKSMEEASDPPANGARESQGERAIRLIGQLMRSHKRIAVVVDMAESMVPRQTFSTIHHEKFTYLQMLKELALDPEIHRHPGLLILLTENLANLEEMLFEGGFFKAIAIATPDDRRRLMYLKYLAGITDESRRLAQIDRKDFPETEGIGPERLANTMKGFTLRAVDDFNRRLVADARANPGVGGPIINIVTVNRHRKIRIAADSANLLVEVSPRGGFECVGGLDHIKGYFRNVASCLRAGDIGSVPKMVLLAGPPGTGKSILAEALAKEAQIPMVKMANVRDKWYGEAERKLELILKILLDWQPVVVFVDEIDQLLGQRMESTSGDSVSRTEGWMFGRLLDFMGNDSNRGKALWIGATNRPDRLDDAMLRRFDRRFPVLLPYETEARIKVLQAFAQGTIPQLAGYGASLQLEAVAQGTSGYTGSEMEQTIRNAIEIQRGLNSSKSLVNSGSAGIILEKEAVYSAIEKTIISRNDLMYELQSLISLDMCNYEDDLPGLSESIPQNLRELMAGLTSKGEERYKTKRMLKERIQEIRMKHRMAM